MSETQTQIKLIDVDRTLLVNKLHVPVCSAHTISYDRYLDIVLKRWISSHGYHYIFH